MKFTKTKNAAVAILLAGLASHVAHANVTEEQLNTAITGVQTQIDDLDTELNDIVDQANTANAEQDAKLEALAGATAGVATLADQANKKAETNADNIESLKNELTTIKTDTAKIAELDLDVQDLVDNIYGDQEDSLVKVVEKNQERIGTLESAQQATTATLAALTPKVQANEEKIAELDLDVQDLVDNIYGDQEDSLVKVVEKNQERIGTLESAQQATTAALTALAPKVQANEEKIAELDADIDEVVASTQEAVDGLSTELKDVADKLDAKQAETANRVDVLTDGFAAIASKVEDNENSIETLAQSTQEAVNDLTNSYNDLDEKKADKTEVEAVVTQINQVADELDALNAKDDELEANKADKADVVAIDTRLVATESKASANKAAIAALEANKADKAEVAKKADQSELDKTNAEVAKKADKDYVDTNLTNIINHVNNTTQVIGDEIGKVKDTANKNKADIADLQFRADTHEDAIKELQARAIPDVSNKADKTEVAAVNSRVDGLENRFGDLEKNVEKGIATNAALSGLFQPYNVGKVNVTAAIGGYKSTAAVAVGAGYRFNDKVAAKAGLSFNTKGGSAAYNVGVNYEF